MTGLVTHSTYPRVLKLISSAFVRSYIRITVELKSVILIVISVIIRTRMYSTWHSIQLFSVTPSLTHVRSLLNKEQISPPDFSLSSCGGWCSFSLSVKWKGSDLSLISLIFSLSAVQLTEVSTSVTYNGHFQTFDNRQSYMVQHQPETHWLLERIMDFKYRRLKV